jgi:hypothetical protein
MAQSAPQVFSGITPAKYASLLLKAQANGLDLAGIWEQSRNSALK